MHAETGALGSASRLTEPDVIDRSRAAAYGLLARLLARAPDPALLDQIGGLEAGAGAVGTARAGLAEAARAHAPEAIAREFFTLFTGVGRGELLPYASYYRTGFLNERPLADLRRDLALIGITRAEGLHDPEDHIAILCDVMRAFALGEIGASQPGERVFFERHLAPWAVRFFDDLASAPSARFYAPVGRFGAAFLALEAEAFALED